MTSTPEEEIQGVQIQDIKLGYKVIDEYEVFAPHSRVKIVSSPELGEGIHYFIEEAPLSEAQLDTYGKIVNILRKEFTSPKGERIDPKEYIYEQAEIIAERYHRSLGKFTIEEWDRVFYYVVRDLTGYGPLQTIMDDPQIEDISCNGIDMPLYIWHRTHESIPTNITFKSNQVLNDFLVKMAHKSGKHISSAQPVLDAMLPEKHRLAATFMKEVSMKGSTFCIRKFREEPFSIVDLINVGTISTRIAAYFWLILEYKESFMIVGGTGAGKTSMLNALLGLMSQNDKIVTVEEVPELNPPATNWTQLNSRESFNFGEGPSGSISLFDLIKVSLRYRPDYVIVGEVRGEDMDVVFGKPQHNETELVLETREVFYYMVMLAEYYHGTISFYIKTDYRNVNVTIIESPEIGVTGEEHRIVAEINGPGTISSTWLNYTTDDWRTENRVQLTEDFGVYVGWLPRFELLDNVQYRVYAEDEIDNSGMGESGFPVLDPVNLRIRTRRLSVNGGDPIEISGEAVDSSEITLRIRHNDGEEIINVNADGEGDWSYMYTPLEEGSYNAKAIFGGDEKHSGAESREITFSMEKQSPDISYTINPMPVKMTREFELSGKLYPPISGISVKLVCITPTSSYEVETITLGDGSFSFFVVPDELGTWQVLPQIAESNFVEGAQGELKSFDVIALTIQEKVTAAILPFTVMPMVLAPVGLGVVGLGYGGMKIGLVRGLIGKAPNTEDPEEDKKSAPKGATSYRRRSSR